MLRRSPRCHRGPPQASGHLHNPFYKVCGGRQGLRAISREFWLIAPAPAHDSRLLVLTDPSACTCDRLVDHLVHVQVLVCPATTDEGEALFLVRLRLVSPICQIIPPVADLHRVVTLHPVVAVVARLLPRQRFAASLLQAMARDQAPVGLPGEPPRIREIDRRGTAQRLIRRRPFMVKANGPVRQRPRTAPRRTRRSACC